MLAHFRITRVDGRTEDMALPLGTYQIGRDVGHIVLNDPNVSGNHARLEVHPHGVLISDAGSINGTFDHEGRRLTEPTRMQLDGAFRLGNSSITLTHLAAPSGGTILAPSSGGTLLAPSSGGPSLPSRAAPLAVGSSAGHDIHREVARPPSPMPVVLAPGGLPVDRGYSGVDPVGAGQSPPVVGYPSSSHPPGGMGPRVGAHRSRATGSFLKHGLLGGVVGGILSIIPVLGMLNMCFCLLNVIGCQIALLSYLKENRNDKLSGGDAAMLGLIAGMTAGIMNATLSFGVMSALMARGGIPLGSGMFLGMMFVGSLLYAVSGALGGALGLHLFFRDRKAS